METNIYSTLTKVNSGTELIFYEVTKPDELLI